MGLPHGAGHLLRAVGQVSGYLALQASQQEGLYSLLKTGHPVLVGVFLDGNSKLVAEKLVTQNGN